MTATGLAHVSRELSPRARAFAAAQALVLTTVLCGFSGAAFAGAAMPPTRSAPNACPITTPNASTPPGEHPTPIAYGNGRLWTTLPLDGRMVVSTTHPPLPGTYFGEVHPDGSISEKFWWWGARSAGSRLRFTGTRLDGHARPLHADVIPGTAHSPRFWATRLTFTTAGCWRVTARAGTAKLSFVIAVSTAPKT